MNERFKIRETETKLTRRHFFSRTSAGLGTMALGQLLSTDASFAAAWKRHRRRFAEPPFSGQSKTGDLSLHERWAIADRLAR